MNKAMMVAMIVHVNVARLKNKLGEYLALVEMGKEVIVCKRNVPVARLERIETKSTPVNRSTLGSMKGTVKILGDLTEPLIPEADWEMLK